MPDNFFIVTCEHASRHIPSAYTAWLAPRDAQDHTAYDAGALAYAEDLARVLGAPLYTAKISRLLIDHNRSLHHPGLFGAALRNAPAKMKQRLIEDYYLPYRQAIKECIATAHAQRQRVIHLAAHSFTPVLNGTVRSAEIGLLYDPRRLPETRLAISWQAALKANASPYRVRRNYPYRGVADGLPTALRLDYPAPAYLGFEIEINQLLWSHGAAAARAFRAWFVSLTREVLINLTSLPSHPTQQGHCP